MTITHPERFRPWAVDSPDPSTSAYMLSDLISPNVSTCGVKVWTINFLLRRGGLAYFIPPGVTFIKRDSGGVLSSGHSQGYHLDKTTVKALPDFFWRVSVINLCSRPGKGAWHTSHEGAGGREIEKM